MKKVSIGKVNLGKYATKFSGFREYGNRYNQIINSLAEDIPPTFFAQPRFRASQNVMDWLIDTNGADLVPFDQLSQNQRDDLLESIADQMDSIKRSFVEKNTGAKSDDISKWFEIPSTSFIVALKDENEQLSPVIYMWGCIERKQGAPSGILSQLIPGGRSAINIKLEVPEIIGKKSNQTISLWVGGKQISTASTNVNGAAELGKLTQGTSFTLKVKEYNLSQQFECDGRALYSLNIPATIHINCLIKDNKERGVPNVPVTFNVFDDTGTLIVENTINTNEQGVCDISGEWYKKKLSAKYFFNEQWSELKEIELLRVQEELVFKLEIDYKFLLVNKQNEPIADHPVVFSLNGEEQQLVSDSKGQLFVEGAADGDTFFLSTKYKRKNYKLASREVSLSEQIYYLKLEKNKWLFLLWFLPLLLLFIPVKQTIHLEVLDNYDKLAVDNAQVNLAYFETDEDEVRQNTLTDSMGCAHFDLGWELLGQKIFFPYPQGQIDIYKTCYQDTTLYLKELSKWSTQTIYLEPYLVKSLDFVLKDSLTGHPIYDADVKVKIEYHSQLIYDHELKSNFGGTITLADIPLCGEIKILASKPFHTSDSLGWVNIATITQELEDRTLYLNSLLEQQTFWVKSTSNRKGLPGALVEAHIESGNFVIDTIQTVAFSDGRVVFPIPDSGRVVLQGSLLGYHDSTYIVSVSLIKNPASQDDLTLWLRPATMPISLLILDTITNQPIANVKVTGKCNGVPIASGTTNPNGEVYLGGIGLDCDLEITTDHPNYVQKIVRKDVRLLLADTLNNIIRLRPVPPPGSDPMDCESGSDGRSEQWEPSVEQIYFMGQESGEFVIKYNTYTEPDHIQIFSGDTEIWSYHKGSLFDKTATVKFNSPYIKVKITGSSAWDYTIFCPEE